MRNRQKLAAQLIGMLFMLGDAGYSSVIQAGGMAVIDMANVKQTTVTAIENVEQTLRQIEQYKTQLMQYENMIRNTMAPPAYLWAQAQYSMNKLIYLTNTIRYYEQQHGGLDGYMQRFRNVEYYRSSPCFDLQGKCNDTAWKLLQDGQNTSTDAQKNANDSLLRGLSEHQNQIPLDAAHLQVLQQRTESAQGQMEALQYANQLAAYQANQLLQMRQMLIVQHNATNTQSQAEVDQKAMQQAAREAATKRLSPEILPAGRNWSVRDAF
ncbi:P-type conjugative transfer protein TrbJ [Nitrosomonas sp. Nm58]|uniref:P-type conjugative transfer protein TrbJ n=1 Tax=Nitrosomonas sp. Nm58 TaxID=200126 RepID=UPI000896E447|nr:P-type conjugative transfer protein TrbJ [Nitrosomonas sp. Nm58]SDZ07053.1 P-type conjugative transfer protein TrbJ [Nitrosomonas sp. Nm58]